MKKIIIFGASGNVGSYLAKYAKEFFSPQEYEVLATGRRDTNVFEKLGIPYFSVDITKPEDFSVLPQKDVYGVMLLSAIIPSYMNDYNPQKYLDVNVLGAFNVLEYCRKIGVKKIDYTQTVFDISLYPHETLSPDLPKNFSYTGDHAMYVISKNTAVEMLRHYHEEYGIDQYVFRLPTIYCYSPFHYYYPGGVKTKRPVYQMIENAMAGKPIELWGNPEYSKDMVHVYDFSQMLCKSMLTEVHSGVYNVGTGIPVTMREQISTIIDVFSPENHRSEIIYRPDKRSGGGFLMDISNAVRDLNYIPQYSCRKLFEDFKSEMAINRFEDLRNNCK